MPDSGFSSISLPGAKAAQQSLGRGGVTVQIIALPDTLQTTTRPVKLTGTLSQIAPNNTATLDTPDGTIEIRIKNPKGFQAGQKIDIEIPAGRPPPQAVLKLPNTPTPLSASASAPVTLQPSAPAQAQPNLTNQPRDNFVRPQENFLTQTIQGEPRSAQTPLQPSPQNSILQNEAVRAVPALPQTPLAPQDTVRLLLVTPSQAQTIIQQTAQTLQNISLTIPSDIFSSGSRQNVVPTIKPDILQNILTPRPPVLPLQTTPFTQNFLTPVSDTGQPFAFSTVQQPSVSLISTPSTAVTALPSVQNTLNPLSLPIFETVDGLPPQALPTNPAISSQGQSVPNLPQQGTVPILTAPANGLSPVIAPQPALPVPAKIDAVIEQINAPTIQLNPPSSSTQAGNPINNLANTIPTAPIILNNAPASAITASVTGVTAEGLPLLSVPLHGRTNLQNFILQFRAESVPAGTQIQFTPQGTQTPTPSLPVQQNSALLRGFQWGALDQLFQILQNLSPQAASALVRSLPTPSNALSITPAAMMFIAAIKSGDLAQWMGQNKIDLLQRAGQEGILRAIRQESGSPTRAPEAQSNADWRAVPLPLFWDNEIQRITLYTRREPQDEKSRDNQDQNNRTRFVLDLDLSRMGAIQIDGFLQDKRLDLILRAQNLFSEGMQQTMRQAYRTALDQTSLTGELHFQGTTKHWVHVLEQTEQLSLQT